ncbi:uncharacterized protein E0L32_009806 [Thyridium curvatum]|uniref:Uncharacterized protein n=1 Tax=Thyridium curvatum TaxID=1093900 RepID=A0A507AQH2_9PEZI|nr:uncharacterized protein E0L32_009806 [Thyridium curvatum]TPX08744.1 hypothetical protein E0L32_009806 [Thyridium curvatum]
MPSPKPPPDDPSPGPATPSTPHRSSPASGAKKATPNNTNNKNDDGATPSSSSGRKAPAGAGGAGGANRQRSSTMKPQPTLLSDFLLGRQTPARVAAARRRSIDAAAVRAELRQEMRQTSVRKLQQPGGVRDRVKNWQKANAAAMAGGGDPEATPTEPTEVGAQLDEESVTEEDRIRIKMRQRAKRRSAPAIHHKGKSETSHEESQESKDGQDHAQGDWEEDGEEEGGAADTPVHTPKTRSPPKKRIVSDEHWMKKRRKSPPRTAPAKTKTEGRPIPRDFLQRTAQNPSVQNKIKDWATRVEPPESPKVKTYNTKYGDTVTVEEDAESGRKSDGDGIRVRPVRKKKTSEKEAGVEDAKPSPKPKKTYEDDGIRVTPSNSSLPDDGIRIRPGPKSANDDNSSVRKGSERSTRIPSARRDRSPSERIEVVEEPESTVETPTRKPKSRKASKSKKSQVASSFTGTQTDGVTEATTKQDEDSASSAGDHSSVGAYEPSSAPGKSLADIPFGYSAFSELDLPHGGSGQRRPKAQRNPSLKAVPKVLKKVMSEGKKIIHNQVDPPKPVVNQPPSIESWLSGTVDPFVDAPAPRKNSVEEDWKDEAKRRSTSASRDNEAKRRSTSTSRDKEAKEAKEQTPPPPPPEPKAVKEETTPKETEEVENQENISPKEPDEKKRHEETPQTPKRDSYAASSTTPKSSGLKRSMATRSAASPLKTGSAKKTFREALREAFRGESGGHNFMPTTYHTVQDDRLTEDEDDSERYESSRRRSIGGSRGRSPSPDPTLSTITESTTTDSASLPATYPKRRPPTNGMHELSTIVSEASYSTHESDTVSTVSQTTITQTTALTATDLTRQKSNRSGLKRRLTKHSDLVSVLSLPDDSQLPARTKSIRVARSLHRKTSKLDNATLDDLLREFAEDENLYSRELKTLVDGVVPVLLTQFVHGDSRRPTDLFDPKSSGSHKTDSLSKSVVSMGIALEKLRNFHKRVPLHDAQALLTWLESVYPVYDNYLDVWRLGFQDLIVNLAPLIGRPGDEDSLVGAMPLNEEGDVLDDNGERVDVAHLLKRPLVRIKWILKFAKGARLILGGFIDGEIVVKLEALQEKARRRHREEMARKADEDANNTDPTRARDLRNLAPISSVHVDRTRQVYAKDWFSLDLSHSSGQRLECQVELVFRDKADDRRDPGDVLIRETGHHGQSWLLFPPVPAGQISARRGQSSRSLVAMIRGSHNMVEWYELLTLTAEDDEAVTEWLDILGTKPTPPDLFAPGPTALLRLEDTALSKLDVDDIPLGEPSVVDEPQASPTRRSFIPPAAPGLEHQRSPKTPSRYHQRRQSRPTTPTSTHSPNGESSPDKTPTQSTYHKSPAPYDARHSSPEDSSRPLREDMRPDPARLAKSSPPNSTPFREDGAPPPPIHRTLTPKKSSASPPVELTSSSRVKRRTSSPLKHEYHPSDVSSEGSASSESSGSESDDSSSDELEEDDIPDTLPGISIKNAEPNPTESVISDSSITPSHSASQVGVNKNAEGETEYLTKSVALTSYWSSRKGIWKDISPEPCSIVIKPGLLEAYPLDASHSHRNSPSPGDANDETRPLIALDLTPVVMIRQSTVVDLEIRSPVRPYSKLNKIESSIFRFRAPSASEMGTLYVAVHQSRLNNAKFKALEEEARFRSFGMGAAASGDAGQEDDTSSRRRSWFGRKNSYRASTRAPSQSQGSSSTGVSASSFLKRLTGGGNLSFNIDKSSVDKQSRVGSGSGSGGAASLYTSEGSSSASGGTPPRSPSVSLAEGSTRGLKALGSDNLRIRCHLAVSASKWEDQGNCLLQITRPPPGMRQELNLYHGMEKRIIVTSIPKKEGEKALVVLDVVLGSRCFGRLGARGIVLNVWEDLRDENNMVGVVPKAGALSGKVKKWCFQCSSAREASWILALVAQEVVIS